MKRAIAALRKERPALQRRAASFLLAAYRADRRLPDSAAAALLSERRRALIILRGEVERASGWNWLCALSARTSLQLKRLLQW